MVIKCANCHKHYRKAYFSSYVLHFLNNNEFIPIFCGDMCMIEWVASKQDKTVDEIRIDFENYCF